MNKLRLDDRIWLRFNRKPTGKKELYILRTLPWLILGGIFLMAMLLTVAVATGEGDARVLLLWIYPIGMTVLTARQDHKHGVMDSQHQHYLQRRKERMAKLNAKLEKEV